MRSEAPRVSIIGAGISGLSLGIYLQRHGFRTEIYEKHAIPGGLCTSWKKGEYMIDGCAHWILGSAPGSSFYKIFNELIDMPSVPFHNHDVRMVVELKKNRDKYGRNAFYLYTNLDQLQAYLLDLSPDDAHLIKPFIRDMRYMQRYDLPPIMDKVPWFQAMIRGIKMSRYLLFLPILWKWSRLTNYTFAARFKSPFLQEAFHYLYDQEEVKMLILMMPISFFDVKSCGYPLGGSYSFAKRFEEGYIQSGGKIHYKKPVREILTENNQAVGIVLRDGTPIRSDIVISSSDWKFTVSDLLHKRYLSKAMNQLLEGKNLEIFYSVIQISLGISRDMKEYPHFFRFPLEEPLPCPDGNTFERMEVHLYHYDPAMAPEGKTTLVVSFYTLYREFWIDLRANDRRQYREIKAAFTEQVIQRLQTRLGSDFSACIEMKDMATPATIYRYTNNWKGSTQGWLPGKNLIASSPVKFTLPGLRNFYYASHWNQPGGGLPVAVITARDACKKICSDYKIPFKPV